MNRQHEVQHVSETRIPEGMPRDLPKTSEKTHFRARTKSRFGAETPFQGKTVIDLQLTAIIPPNKFSSVQLLAQARSNLASNAAQTDAPRNTSRSLPYRVSPDRLKLAEPVRRRRLSTQ
jgi:hypothetical protein